MIRDDGAPGTARQIRPLRDAAELIRFARNLEVLSADKTVK
jgi:hypothetical protein